MMVSYAGLTLMGVTDFFSQPADVSAQGASRLLEFFEQALGDSNKLPNEFVKHLLQVQLVSAPRPLPPPPAATTTPPPLARRRQ